MDFVFLNNNNVETRIALRFMEFIKEIIYCKRNILDKCLLYHIVYGT